MSVSGLPPDLLRAVSSPGGGKLAFVLGAGCSMESPTNMPLGPACSEEMHRRLVADGVLKLGDCENPKDLSILADTVFAKHRSQQALVQRFCDAYHPKNRPANEGYLIAAALLMEGAISSIVTLNFDLALTAALSDLGSGTAVGIVDSPSDLTQQRRANVFYLHRNANAVDTETWILRSASLLVEWKNHWESLIVKRVLTTPVVVFAGLGTAAAVLVESTKLIRNALPSQTQLFQVDTGDPSTSAVFKALGLATDDFIPGKWCEFMFRLSMRLVEEHTNALNVAAARKVSEEHLASEDITSLLRQLNEMGLVAIGRLRSAWLLLDIPYGSAAEAETGLLSDLLLAIASIQRHSGTVGLLSANGLVEFRRDGHPLASFSVASGRGHRSCAAVETTIRDSRHRYEANQMKPQGAIIAGTADYCRAVTPPLDLVRGDPTNESIVDGANFRLFHVADLRQNPDLIAEMLP